MSTARATIDHEAIKQWVETRGGCPAHVKGSGSDGDPGILRIDFEGFSGKQRLEEISWDTFFKAFDDNSLAFIFSDDEERRFSKFVARDSVELEGSKG
ncbi:MAG TPA: hypothetical protein VFY39_06885, partial [Gammaproteobacteria bacterium]|nr:hypothetical protein [Gammaproteobacteria bacterium]